MTTTTVSFAQLLRDLYVRPGERIKQWVADTRDRVAWINKTCPRVVVEEHRDNTDVQCWASGWSATWYDLHGHSCCYVCTDKARELADRPDIAAWRELLAAQPPVCADRDMFSDRVEPPCPSAEALEMRISRRGRR